MRCFLYVFVSVFLVSGCTHSDDNQDYVNIEPGYLSYDLHYNEVSMKASHNSYQRDERLIDQIVWNDEVYYNNGCRSIELDISQSCCNNDWSVGHKYEYDIHYRQLSQFLSELSVWSRNNPGHDVITVFLDLKHVENGFPEALDLYIRDHLDIGLGSEVFTPGELMGVESSLRIGALANGWPTLGELKGKFIICLTGDKNAKSFYARTSPSVRLCFADMDADPGSVPDSEYHVFFNFHLYTDEMKKWKPVLRECAFDNAAVVRAYVLNNGKLWYNALVSGCNILATDKVSHYEWARVGDYPFVKLKPL